jgi:CheY-like chemotaxis protein
MTAHALTSYQQKCFEAGMNDFIAKLINFDELKSVIAKVLNNS